MSNTISNLWNGTLAPRAHCGSRDPEVIELMDLLERNQKALLRTLTKPQLEVFQKYLDCVEDHRHRMAELAFCDGFILGGRLASEIHCPAYRDEP